MCGIVGTSWSKKAREFIIGGLEKLEYRGYDSAGIYYLDKDNKSNLIRTIERVKKLKDITPHFDEGIAIGHTRWATHGGVSINNAILNLPMIKKYLSFIMVLFLTIKK